MGILDLSSELGIGRGVPRGEGRPPITPLSCIYTVSPHKNVVPWTWAESILKQAHRQITGFSWGSEADRTTNGQMRVEIGRSPNGEKEEEAPEGDNECG